jgi:hypothetical protein
MEDLHLYKTIYYVYEVNTAGDIIRYEYADFENNDG